MKKLILVVMIWIVAPIAMADDKAGSYQALKYGDVVTDDGDVICDGDGDADCEIDDCSCDDDDN